MDLEYCLEDFKNYYRDKGFQRYDEAIDHYIDLVIENYYEDLICGYIDEKWFYKELEKVEKLLKKKFKGV